MDLARLHQHLARQMPGLGADEVTKLTAAFTLRTVPKRALLVQPGVVVDHRLYVLKGTFRAYVVDPAGENRPFILLSRTGG